MRKLWGALLGGLLLAGSAFAASNPWQPLAVANVATLTGGSTLPSQHPVVNLLGYYASGDGGGGTLVWDPNSTVTAEPCMTYAVSGIGTGRYIRQLNGRPLSTFQCGVKADGATNNTSALAALMTAATANSLATVYCPNSSGVVNFAGTVNIPMGTTLLGEGNNQGVTGNTGAPSSCTFNFTGVNVPAFSTQTAVTNACPRAQGPSIKNISLLLSNQTSTAGIKFNDPATAGFNDDCSITPGQSVLLAGEISNVVILCNQRGTSGIQLSKIFNYAVRDNTISFCDYPFEFQGSDNIDFQHNTISNATIADLKLVGHGTFGNMFYAHNNTFNSPYINAPYFIDSTYGQLLMNSNYLESQQVGGSCAVYLHGGFDNTIVHNGMYISPALMPRWLCADGVWEHLMLDNNWDGGLGPTALFNSGNGYQFMYNGGGVQATIEGGKNPGGNGGIPYFTNFPLEGPGALTTATPPSAAGALLAQISASSPNGATGLYGAAVRVKSGCFVLPALSGTQTEVQFSVRPVVSDTVDLWVYGFADSGSTQLVSVSLDAGASYTTQALTTTPTWYKVISNVAVVNPILAMKNSDLAHGSINDNVCVMQLVKH